jgi:hypothetical protein
MIVALVRFPLGTTLDRDVATDAFAASAVGYQTVPGLVRKHFLLGEDATTAGGIYFWESRAEADAFYNDAWRARLAAKYGEPTVDYFDAVVSVDPESITRT